MTRKLSLHNRSCGILLHITSLPSRFGIGDLGGSARRFADFLAKAGQSWWQVLPIHPIGPGDSPYSSPSAFAGSPVLIDPDQLISQGLIKRDGTRPPRGISRKRVRYPVVLEHRQRLLRRAFDAFTNRRTDHSDFEQFCHKHGDWLDDYALYQTLKDAHGGASWTHWDTPCRRRRHSALREAMDNLRQEVQYHRHIQFLFFRQWLDFKRHCNGKGIGLIGDLPMFVNHDSCDVWAHRELFRVDRDGRMKVVSGAPPDAFIATGQKWGHPLYRWSGHRPTGFAWWLARFRHMFALFDAVRVDHFLGFDRCWAVEADAPTAEDGHWSTSPGQELFSLLDPGHEGLAIIAEDLGEVTPAASRLRERYGLLGMRILQNGFGEGARYDQPHRYPKRCVAYTGTHDNDTTVGWFKKLPRGRRHRGKDGLTDRQRVLRYTGTDGSDIHRDLIRLLFLSRADLVIVPIQDVLGLGSLERMNRPGTPTGNWDWRMTETVLSDRLANELGDMARAYERVEEITV